MAVPLLGLSGLGEQLYFFFVAWVCSPFTALLALRLVRRWRPSYSSRRRALWAIFLVSTFNVAFGLLISEPPYLTVLDAFLIGPLPVPFAVALILAFQR